MIHNSLTVMTIFNPSDDPLINLLPFEPLHSTEEAFSRYFKTFFQSFCTNEQQTLFKMLYS